MLGYTINGICSPDKLLPREYAGEDVLEGHIPLTVEWENSSPLCDAYNSNHDGLHKSKWHQDFLNAKDEVFDTQEHDNGDWLYFDSGRLMLDLPLDDVLDKINTVRHVMEYANAKFTERMVDIFAKQVERKQITEEYQQRAVEIDAVLRCNE